MPGHQRRKPVPSIEGRPPPTVTPGLLRGWPLPQPSDDDDKEGRGRVLTAAGSPELPGTAILAATAALRAGAGKLRIATVASIAPHVGIAVPEARVFALAETERGGVHPDAAAHLAELANDCQAALLGPGLVDTDAIRRL